MVGTEYTFYNDSRVVFLSPAVPEEPEAYNLTALIQMDGHRVLLRSDVGSFEYVADPTFKNFTGGVKKQVNKLIHAQVRAGCSPGVRVLGGQPQVGRPLRVQAEPSRCTCALPADPPRPRRAPT